VRILWLFTLLIFSFSANILAETVILKSGEKLEGKIVEQTDKYIKMDPGVGIVMTYYTDDIDTIDGQKLQTTAPSIQPQDQSQPQTEPEAQPDAQPEPQTQTQTQTSLPNTPAEVQQPVNSDAENYYALAVAQYNNGDYIDAFKNINAAQRSGYTQDLESFKERIQAAIDQQETEKNLRRAQEYNSHPYYHSSSSSNSGKDIGYAIFGLFFGIFSFFKGFGTLRKKRAIESIPTSTVRGLAIGMVELNGKAKKTRTLQAPLSGTECTFYRYTIERYESSGRSSRWVLISQGDSVFCPFCLDDATGEIMVLPWGAEFVMPADYTFTTSLGSGLPENLINFMGKSGIQYKGLFGNYTLRFTEWHIKPEESVFVVGTAQKHTTQLDQYMEKISGITDKLKQSLGQAPAQEGIGLEEWSRAAAHTEHGLLQEVNKSDIQQDLTDVIIAKGDNSQIFIISDESQAEVVKSFSWKAFAGIWGGSALSLAMLAYLLFRLGLWSRF